MHTMDACVCVCAYAFVGVHVCVCLQNFIWMLMSVQGLSAVPHNKSSCMWFASWWVDWIILVCNDSSCFQPSFSHCRIMVSLPQLLSKDHFDIVCVAGKSVSIL
jgi:hypothetical protein